VVVDQALIDEFARLSGDDYWIHTDPDKARKQGPFGGTIAHGALVQVLQSRMKIPLGFEVTGFTNMVNYGSDRLRFPSPVPAGAHPRPGPGQERRADEERHPARPRGAHPRGRRRAAQRDQRSGDPVHAAPARAAKLFLSPRCTSVQWTCRQPLSGLAFFVAAWLRAAAWASASHR
jgi:hypothetical protein